MNQTKIEKTVSINFDGKQFFIRIPTKVSEFLQLKEESKARVIVDVSVIEEVKRKIMVEEVVEKEEEKEDSA